MANLRLTPILLTRPNDTTLYTVGDAIAALTANAVMFEIPSFASAAGGVAILDKLQILTSQKACQAGLRVHFYNDINVSAAGIIEDNAVFAQLTADKLLDQGFLDMDAFNTEDTTSTYASTFLKAIGLELQSDSNNKVYGQLQIKTGAFTPDALQTFHIIPWVVQ